MTHQRTKPRRPLDPQVNTPGEIAAVLAAYRDGLRQSEVAERVAMTERRVNLIIGEHMNAAERRELVRQNLRRAHAGEKHARGGGFHPSKEPPGPDEIRARAAVIRAEGIAALAALGAAGAKGGR